MTSLSVLQTCAAFDHAGLVIVGFGSLGLIVASLTSPASETAATASGGTTPPSPWKDENGRIAFAPPAALTGVPKMREPPEADFFPVYSIDCAIVLHHSSAGCRWQAMCQSDERLERA